MGGLRFGTCKYEVTLPELDGGKGVRLRGEIKVGRLQLPGADGTRAAAATPRTTLLRRAAAVWSLVGLGWILPNAILLGAIAWARRRARARPAA